MRSRLVELGVLGGSDEITDRIMREYYSVISDTAAKIVIKSGGYIDQRDIELYIIEILWERCHRRISLLDQGGLIVKMIHDISVDYYRKQRKDPLFNSLPLHL